MLPWLVALLIGIAAAALGGSVLLLLRERRQARLLRARLAAEPAGGAEGSGGGVGAFGSPADAGAAGDAPGALLESVGRAVAGRGTSRSLAEQLARAGFFAPSAPAIYLGTKIVLFGIGLLAAALLVLPLGLDLPLRLFLVGLLSCGLSFVPNVVVSARRNKRSAEVRRHLPDAVDMLEICVSAGMGLDAAWTAVAEEIRRVSPIFADEMELTNLELGLGVPRAVAMRHMAVRTGAEDLASLVALLVQSERFGAGIVDALTTFARTLRETRSQRAEEVAERMSVKLLFPMVLFIFPALLIVMVGPAVIELIKVLTAD